MTVLVYLEHEGGVPTDPSRQALTFARRSAQGDPTHAVVVGGGLDVAGVTAVHVAQHDVFDSYAPAAAARAVAEVAERTSASVVIGPGTERGNEVMARLAALADLPFAANCIAAVRGEVVEVTRVRWGGSLLEEARVHGSPALLTVQPHAIATELVDGRAAPVEAFTPALAEADTALRVISHVAAATGGVSLSDATVVVSAGRGAGSPEGFAGG